MSIDLVSEYVVPSPQLAEEFDLTLADLSFGQVVGFVTVGSSAPTPKFGAGRGLIDYTPAGGNRAIWGSTQMSVNDFTRFMVATWIYPASVAGGPPATVFGMVSDDFDALLKFATGGPPSFFFDAGTPGTPFDFPAAAWAYVEMRGWLTAGAWTVEARVNGVDVYTELAAGTVATTAGQVGALPADCAGLILGFDRMWWWAGTDTDPRPQWWSSVEGWDGEPPPLEIFSAVIGPEEFTATLGTIDEPSGDLMWAESGVDGEVNVTIAASVTLDPQVVEIGFAPRSGPALDWVTAAWIGVAGTERAAMAEIGPSFAFDPDPAIYELWGRLDSGMPFRVVGELVVV